MLYICKILHLLYGGFHGDSIHEAVRTVKPLLLNQQHTGTGTLYTGREGEEREEELELELSSLSTALSEHFNLLICSGSGLRRNRSRPIMY